MKQSNRVRNLSWEDYGISRHLQNELKAFCLQYEEKKDKIQYSIRGASYGVIGKCSHVSQPTERLAIENARLEHDCALIEKAAECTSAELAPYILKSVTQDITYEYLEYDEELGRIPVGKTDFYGYRRRFFYYLQKMRIGDK